MNDTGTFQARRMRIQDSRVLEHEGIRLMEFTRSPSPLSLRDFGCYLTIRPKILFHI